MPLCRPDFPHQCGPSRRRRRRGRHAEPGVGDAARDLLDLRVGVHGDDPLRRLLVAAAAVVIPLDVQQRLHLQDQESGDFLRFNHEKRDGK